MRQFLKHYLPKNTRAKLLMVERWIKLLVRPGVIRDLQVFNELKGQVADDRFSTKLKDIYPITGENTSYTSFDRHYVYHTSWAARVVGELQKEAKSKNAGSDFKHIDISSSLYFAGLVSAFVPVEFYDYRPALLRLDNLETHAGNLMKLPFGDKSIASISCMHTIEHIGLGRYGDTIDPKGDIKAITELKRTVAPGGSLLLVMPVGKQRIQFNAHRIYQPSYIADLVCEEKDFTLREYAYIPETDGEGGIIRDANLKQGSQDEYGCGCFWFVRTK